MFFEPVIDLIGVVAGQVIHDGMPIPNGIAGVDRIEQIHEGISAALVCGEAEELATSDIVGAHESQCSVPDVLELTTDRLAGLHGDVGIQSFKRLDARLLIDADDVLTWRRLVVDAE